MRGSLPDHRQWKELSPSHKYTTRNASQMAVFDNKIERWGEEDVPYLPSQFIGSYSNE
ncbi:hypothetical protein J6590_089753 [Homalodisca vitripennis]|nr:hypothetical protein J6590_089753 [Homalodisca vitripennis]